MADNAFAESAINAAGALFSPPKPDAPIGVVIPGYGHPRLLGEAVVSACEQSCDNPIYAVIVDDGCKYPETAEIAQSLIQKYSGHLFYLRQPNTRLPGARNAGIRFLLENFDDLEAIFFLDADNRLQPHALETYYKTLIHNPNMAWAYPDINFFGMTWGTEGFDTRITSQNYSVLKHLVGNISEAGSLVRADVFRRGHLYDETMRDGFEDWEFWLQLLSAGYRGVRAENAGFFYRRRSESMLTDSRRIEENIISGMRRKHAALYSMRNVMRLEHEEAPAFAVVLADKNKVLKFSDPFAEICEISLSEFQREMQAWLTNPHENFFPVKTLITNVNNWDALLSVPHWLRWALWRIRGLKKHFSFVSLCDREAVNFEEVHDFRAEETMIVLSQDAIQKMYQDKSMYHSETNTGINFCLPGIGLVTNFDINNALDMLMDDAVLVNEISHISQRYAGPSAIEVRRTLSDEMTAEEARQPFGVCTEGQRYMIGLGQASFSESETQTDQLLKILGNQFNANWEGVLSFERSGESNAFTDVSSDSFKDFVPLDVVANDTECRNFMGREFRNILSPDAREDGSLVVRTCNWLIALGSCGLVEIMGEARAHGVRTSVVLHGSHLSDDDLTRILAYEHAIAEIVCDDREIKALLAGCGVPPGKIISFDTFKTVIAETH